MIKNRLMILVLLISLFTVSVPSPAFAVTPDWAPATEASIRPGVATLTGDALCTSNFVFFDEDNVYLGQAAHCSSTVAATALDGCANPSLPVGSPVRIAGATQPGVLVYNSWIEMQQRGETDSNTCLFNDFALIRLDPQDRFRVNPSVPFWGGPTGLVPTSFAGAEAFGYGTTVDRSTVRTHAKRGFNLRQGGGGWTHILEMSPRGVAGDSGSGIIDGQGRAYGVMSTLSMRRGINGAGDLSRQLDYAAASGFPGLTLATGTEPFNVAPPANPVPAPDPLGDLVRSLLGELLG